MSKQLSPSDVMQMTGLSRQTVINLFHSTDFPSYKIGNRWFVDEDDFAKWRDRRKEEKSVEINYVVDPLLEKWRQKGYLKGPIRRRIY